MPKPNATKKDFISWLNFYLRGTAIRPTRRPVEDACIILYHILVFGLFTLGSFVLFGLNYADISINTDPLLYSISAGHTLFVYCVYLRSRRKLCGMTTVMQTRFRNPLRSWKPGRHEEIWNKSDKLSTRLMRCHSYSGMSLVCFYVFNAKPLSPDRQLVLPMWVPFSLQSDARYLAVFCFQVSVCVLYVFVNVAGCGLCIGAAHFIGAAFDVLGQTFQDMCESQVTSSKRGSPRDSKVQLDLDEELMLWVKRHIVLLRFIDDYKSVFQNVLLEVIVSSVVILCFSGFQMVLAVEEMEIVKVGVLIGTVSLFVFHLFMFCYPGQHIYNKSEQLRNTLYSSHWEFQSPLFKKHFTYILTHTLRPVDINFKNMVYASLPAFIQALRTAFSYVNILMILRTTN